MAPGCDLVVVIPVFKQPGLLIEAVDSVLRQQTSLDIRMLIVDDGCPFKETRDTGVNYARAYPDRIVYLRRQNGGLSAARNTGIDHALRLFPQFRALYLLDADNRLAPAALQTLFDVLMGAGTEVGWAYPDIDMFGQNINYAVGGAYSGLAHLRENFCEAGSLIARRLIDAGARFDEGMRHGFEDWDFWLQALELGFRGIHARDSGFRYRRRAESMLAHAERMRPAILRVMRDKHALLLRARSLIRLEEREAPRFLHYVRSVTRPTTFVDPRRPRMIEAEDAAMLVARARRLPFHAAGPHILLFSEAGALTRLAVARLDRMVLWRAQRLLEIHDRVMVLFASDAARLGVETLAPAPAAADEAAQMILLRGADPAAEAKAGTVALICRAPHLAAPATGALADFVAATVAGLEEAVKGYSPQNPEWRQEIRRPRTELREAFALDGPMGAVLPHIAPQGRPQVGFILPLVEFGGVEKVVMNYARVCREAGCDVHLFVILETGIGMAAEAIEVFASINFIDHPAARADSWDRIYDGVAASNYAEEGFAPVGLGLLATMDIVLNSHSLAAHSLMEGLRRQGIKTYVGLHLVEVSSHGHPMGNPNVALAFEHVYDGFVVISRKMRDWCLANGVPDDKILLAPNAASYAADPEFLRAARAARRRRKPGTPLRALYLGRLDAQKGLDRLETIMRLTQATCAWRVIGRAVLGDAAALEAPVEPPLFSARDLDDAYAWADVLVLPSRFEGAPLTILEAQRFGCIPIAANVGAVGELIENEVDGLLIDEAGEDQLIAKFAMALMRLAAAPDLVAQLADSCAARQENRNWRDNLQSWLAHALPPAEGCVRA